MGGERSDFFISYNRADRRWAEWIAHVLVEGHYTVVIQAWDFRPGNNFALEMQKALVTCDRTIAVLSPDYLTAPFPQAEWATVFAADPEGAQRKLIPVMVRKCQPTGLLAQIIYLRIDYLTEDAARQALLNGVKIGRAVPTSPPAFPGPAFPRDPRP